MGEVRFLLVPFPRFDFIFLELFTRQQLKNKLTYGVHLAAVPVRIRNEEHVRVNSGVTL